MYIVKGYHSCRAEGSKAELSSKVPFLSRPNNQWLGQGYYFWTEDAYWAKKWRREGEEIVISEFEISINKNKLLDLVGSIQGQIYFSKVIEAFSKRRLSSEFTKRYGNKLCVSSVISWLIDERKVPGKEAIFPFWAIRAKDGHSLEKIPFLASRSEMLPLVERHQMCVYSDYKDQVVRFERFIHPPHFMDETENGEVA